MLTMGDLHFWDINEQYGGVLKRYSPALTSSPLLRARACNLGRVDGRQSRLGTAPTRDDYIFEDLHFHMVIDGELYRENGDTDAQKSKIYERMSRASKGLIVARGS